jgi:hypothetical protein
MHDEILNPRVLALDDSHPVKRFLLAFIECRGNCVGLALDPDEPIDQEWESFSDGRVWTFSGFAYAFLSLDIALDDFHHRIPCPTDSSTNWPWNLTRLRSLMHEGRKSHFSRPQSAGIAGFAQLQCGSLQNHPSSR